MFEAEVKVVNVHEENYMMPEEDNDGLHYTVEEYEGMWPNLFHKKKKKSDKSFSKHSEKAEIQ